MPSTTYWKISTYFRFLKCRLAFMSRTDEIASLLAFTLPPHLFSHESLLMLLSFSSAGRYTGCQFSQKITYDPGEASKRNEFPGVSMSINVLKVLKKNPNQTKTLAFFLQFKWDSPAQKGIKEQLTVEFSSAPLWLDGSITSILQLGKYTLINLCKKLIFRERHCD